MGHPIVVACTMKMQVLLLGESLHSHPCDEAAWMGHPIIVACTLEMQVLRWERVCIPTHAMKLHGWGTRSLLFAQ